MRLIRTLLLLSLFLMSYAHGQWGQPNPQYQQVCGIPNAPPCPGQYPQYQQPPPQAYGYQTTPQPAYPQQNYVAPMPSGNIDGACMGRCTGQGGSWAQCQRVCN